MNVKAEFVALRDGYIEVSLEGASTGLHSRYREIHDRAFAASLLHSCERILIDASRVAYEPNVLLEHQTAMDLAQHCAAHPFRVCIATISPPQAYAANEHLETAARNRGVNVEVFRDRDTALSWLLPSGR